MTLILRYLFNIVIALDQLANTIIGGDPDETISSRIAKRRSHFPWLVLAKIIEAVDPGHLDRFTEDDEGADDLTDEIIEQARSWQK